MVRENRHDTSNIDEVFSGVNAEGQLVIESADVLAGNGTPSWQV
jgi:hypothetical protein